MTTNMIKTKDLGKEPHKGLDKEYIYYRKKLNLKPSPGYPYWLWCTTEGLGKYKKGARR